MTNFVETPVSLSPETIRANRREWIGYLRLETTKKGTGRLDKGIGHRCCLGHACHVLGLEGTRLESGGLAYSGEMCYAPQEVVDRLGLWDSYGSTENFDNDKPLSNGKTSLVTWNDDPFSTQAEIADYLESVLDGGPDTPFKPL